MMHLPYPRMLYRGAEQCIVGDYRQEQDANTNGWGPTPGWVTPPPVAPEPPPPPDPEPTSVPEPEPVRRGRGRPRKS